MEVPGGSQKKPLVATYELIGTALFVYIIIMSGGDSIGIPLALFAMIIILGGVTGGHFNPAVTLGVYIHEGKWAENAGFAILIAAFQIIGGLMGMMFASFTLSANIDGVRTIVDKRIPILAPKDPKGENDYDMLDDSDGFSQDAQTFLT